MEQLIGASITEMQPTAIPSAAIHPDKKLSKAERMMGITLEDLEKDASEPVPLDHARVQATTPEITLSKAERMMGCSLPLEALEAIQPRIEESVEVHHSKLNDAKMGVTPDTSNNMECQKSTSKKVIRSGLSKKARRLSMNERIFEDAGFDRTKLAVVNNSAEVENEVDRKVLLKGSKRNNLADGALNNNMNRKPVENMKLTVRVQQTAPQLFRQLQMQRQGRKPSPLQKRIKKEQATSLPVWYHPVGIVSVSASSGKQVALPSSKVLNLESWMESFEIDAANYHSAIPFVEIKLREADILNKKLRTNPNRFSTAVICTLFDRIVRSILQIKKMRRYHSILLELQHKLYELIFVDAEDIEASDGSKTLSYFMEMQSYCNELTMARTNDKAKQLKSSVVFRQFVESGYQSLVRTFQAWKLITTIEKIGRKPNKGARITKIILSSRKQLQLIFVSWSRLARNRTCDAYRSISTEQQAKLMEQAETIKEQEQKIQQLLDLQKDLEVESQAIRDLENEITKEFATLSEELSKKSFST